MMYMCCWVTMNPLIPSSWMTTCRNARSMWDLEEMVKWLTWPASQMYGEDIWSCIKKHKNISRCARSRCLKLLVGHTVAPKINGFLSSSLYIFCFVIKHNPRFQEDTDISDLDDGQALCGIHVWAPGVQFQSCFIHIKSIKVCSLTNFSSVCLQLWQHQPLSDQTNLLQQTCKWWTVLVQNKSL